MSLATCEQIREVARRAVTLAQAVSGLNPTILLDERHELQDIVRNRLRHFTEALTDVVGPKVGGWPSSQIAQCVGYAHHALVPRMAEWTDAESSEIDKGKGERFKEELSKLATTLRAEIDRLPSSYRKEPSKSDTREGIQGLHIEPGQVERNEFGVDAGAESPAGTSTDTTNGEMKPKEEALTFLPGAFFFKDRRQELKGKPLEVLRALNEARWKRLTLAALCKKVWGAAQIGEETIRSAVASARKALRKAIADAGIEGPSDPIPCVGRGMGQTAWHLNLP